MRLPYKSSAATSLGKGKMGREPGPRITRMDANGDGARRPEMSQIHTNSPNSRLFACFAVDRLTKALRFSAGTAIPVLFPQSPVGTKDIRARKKRSFVQQRILDPFV